MHSLRTKITMLTTCITVIAVVVVTVLSVAFIRNTEHRKSDQLLLLLCETGERNLDYYFNSVEKSVRKVATFTERDLDGLDDEHLAKHTERVSKYFDEIANKTNGALTYYYRIDPSISEKVKGFWFINLDGKDFVEHEVTDITQYDTEDTSKLVWFTVPKYTGNPVWLPPYITDNLDVKVISYNIPVYHRGQFVGVIGIEIDHSMMAGQVESIRLYNNGYAFLTDAEGNLMFHPRIDIAQLTEGTAPTMPDGLLSDSTFTTYTFDGEEKEAVWLRLGNGMRLYVSVPLQETDGDWRQLIHTVIIGAAIVLALSILLTEIIMRKITRPLLQLTEAAKKADGGDYDFTLDYNGKDEVGTLTRTFRRMADHMKEHISELNKRVYVDALTSVRNKGAFANYIEELQTKVEEDPEHTEFAIAAFDCDDLKSVNDLYGHEKGDIYLKTSCRMICKVFQHSPVFRIGGDEFAAVLRGSDYEHREELTREFERASAESREKAGNRWEQVRVAIGIAAYDPQQDHSVVDTVRRADKIMYINKKEHKTAGG
ncbi:MAG: diguanylate cyclase [Clostridia bacterium]